MKMKFLMAVMVLAAMGPGRNAPAPEVTQAPGGSAARLPPVTQAPAREAHKPATLTVHAASDVAPDDFVWSARPLVIFADTPGDPAFLRQLQEIEARPAPLIDRDVVVITDTDPAAATVWRRDLRPRGFSLVLIDKDGQVKHRRPSPWDVREITRAIDKFPLRRQEIGRMGVTP